MLMQIRPLALAILAGLLVSFFGQLGTNVREVKRGFADHFDPRPPAQSDDPDQDPADPDFAG